MNMNNHGDWGNHTNLFNTDVNPQNNHSSSPLLLHSFKKIGLFLFIYNSSGCPPMHVTWCALCSLCCLGYAPPISQEA